ncbi:MAG: glycosyltransferase, partial [Candidatus Roizmanbacteria bacterium]|nr:glycosyltransferase [Candidatus Roizmanbacteria bacterium]
MAKKLKIALVHDFLKEYGGAERVVEALHDMWPDAPVYTSFVDYESLGPHADRIKKWHIVESPFGSSWLMRRFHSPLRFLAPWVWNSFDFSKFDVVISSSGWYISRGITVRKPTIHICYLHHPPRHLYGYQTAMDWQKYWPVRLYGTIVNHFLRMYDYDTAQSVDYFIANSEETKRRIQKFYRRDSTVIYPPVDIPKKTVFSGLKRQSLPKNYYLVVSRLARAKHIDLVIKACQELDKSLVIVGKGREENYLRQIANGKSSTVTFLGEVRDEELPGIYQNAKALVFPSEDEEFGIVPVEAMGYGIPVIALRSG